MKFNDNSISLCGAQQNHNGDWDLQSYRSSMPFFLACKSNKLFILVDNRPWLIDLDSRVAQLWHLMITKVKFSTMLMKISQLGMVKLHVVVTRAWQINTIVAFLATSLNILQIFRKCGFCTTEAQNIVEPAHYKDVLILFRFNDHTLPLS
ncbi:hypothetical protein C5167_046959 [Papaver somniferum]|uniref:Uncharacterized protein n=1 Tax=Papaver somniferum TaxID=3469 RepID=A0A4Y7LHI2_PAPSO|nr:hypothetical protein C5167_046959 [Papaver somniferum]